MSVDATTKLTSLQEDNVLSHKIAGADAIEALK
jgi:hypothetical protein